MNKESNTPAWFMLFSRITLFAGWQAIIALIFYLRGSNSAWTASIAWWPISATLTNLICIGLLIWLNKREGLRYWDIFRFRRDTLKGDLGTMAWLTVVIAILATVPNLLIAQWLFGDPQATVAMFVKPLPLWAILPALVLFPVTISLAELPTYFSYVMPRIEKGVGAFGAIAISGIVLAAQHITLPLIFDGRFLLWRLLMFLPFALVVAIVMKWRARLLPYLVILHGLLDLSTAIMVLSVSIK